MPNTVEDDRTPHGVFHRRGAFLPLSQARLSRGAGECRVAFGACNRSSTKHTCLCRAWTFPIRALHVGKPCTLVSIGSPRYRARRPGRSDTGTNAHGVHATKRSGPFANRFSRRTARECDRDADPDRQVGVANSGVWAWPLAERHAGIPRLYQKEVCPNRRGWPGEALSFAAPS